MTHTHDTLMAKIDHYAYRVSDHMPSYSEARAALSAALQEVLAERDRKSEAVQRLWKERDEAIAERDALAKDAARYRWLRMNYDDSLVMVGGDKGCAELYMEEELDKAIDIAMKGTPT